MKDVRPEHGNHLQSLAVLFAIVTFGLSQIVFNLVAVKPQAFSPGYPFIFWTLLWITIIPLLILFGIELVFRRHPVLFSCWRIALYALLVLSLVRQFLVFHADTVAPILSVVPEYTVYAFFVLATPALMWRFRAYVERYLSILGVAAVIFPLMFFYQLRSVADLKTARPVSSAIPGSQEHPPIIVLVFDELSMQVLAPNGIVDARHYPNFSKLTQEALWCEEATTNHWATVDSLPAMLTGKIHPNTTSKTLFEFLASDYQATVMLSEIEVENWLRYKMENASIDRYAGKDHFINANPFSAAQFLGSRLWGFFFYSLPANILFDDPEYHATLSRERTFAQSLDLQDRRMLFWHISVPHAPFLFTSEGKRHHRKESYFPFAEEYDVSQFRFVIGNYKEQVQFADLILGEMILKLKQSGLYDRAILIVTSDHGVRIWGNLFRHVDWIANVPFFVRAPGVKPGKMSGDVQLVDMTPTILDLLGTKEPPANFDGTSIFASSRSVRKKQVNFHPSQVQYTWDASARRWEKGDPLGLGIAQVFSTMLLLDDIFLAHETGKDFLTLYLNRHFPRTISPNDQLELKKAIDAASSMPVNSQNDLKQGVYYFFLGLTASQFAANGEKVDASETNHHFQQSLYYLGRSHQSLIFDEIATLIRDSDSDRDGELNEQELAKMIQSRPREELAATNAP